MRLPQTFTLPEIARTARRVALPTTLVTGLVAGGLAGAVVFAAPARAANAGTFEIGDVPVPLNQPSDPEMGVLKPSADAADNGMFGSVAPWPVIALHATVSRNGHLTTFGTPVNTVAQSGISFDDWNPAAGLSLAAHTDTPAEHGYDGFCNAAVALPDGRILMVSGQMTDKTSADMMTMVYDPITKAQTMGATLGYKRWYVTALRLPDQRILLLGGGKAGNTGAYQTPDDQSGVATVPEIGTGTGEWTQLKGAASTELFGAAANRWWYPRAFNGSGGKVVGASDDRVWSLDPSGDGSVQQTGTLPYSPKVSGSQVMYAPGKILFAGGGQTSNTEEVAGTTAAAILDVGGATPQSALTSPMRFGRNWLNLTVLPTGDVFANGGTTMGTDAGEANSVKQAEIWNPASGTWRTAANAQMTRTYHSTSVLLPSGAVFTGGGGNPGPVDNFNAELYYPAYLFSKGADGTVSWASRPAISAISGSATYGGTMRLKIGDGRRIASASLITLPSETHSQNTDQRRIPLEITQQGDTVSATLPNTFDTMPPGDFELTVVDGNGVPSAGQIITVRSGAAGLVTVADAPQGGQADGGGAGGGAGAGAGAGAAPGVPLTSTVKLKKGATISLMSAAVDGSVLARSGRTVTLRKVGRGSSRSSRAASSWIVRGGLASAKGISFESVDKPGWFLTAPKKGSQRATIVKRSKSKTFTRSATFSAVKGVLGHDTSFRLTTNAHRYLRSSRTGVTVGTISESVSSGKSATFLVQRPLATRR